MTHQLPMSTPETALCCRCFTLPLGPEELWENYYHWVLLEFGSAIDSLDAPMPPKDDYGWGPIEDIEWLAEHLRYIGLRPPSYGGYRDPDLKKTLIHFYTCDMIDPKTGRCIDHENRPSICRNYYHCEHPHRCKSTWCSCHPEVGRIIMKMKICEGTDDRTIGDLIAERKAV